MIFKEAIIEAKVDVRMKAGLYQFWKQLKEKGKTKLTWKEWYKGKKWERKK